MSSPVSPVATAPRSLPDGSVEIIRTEAMNPGRW